MARTRKPHVIRLTADHLFVTAPDGATTMDLLSRMNVPGSAPAFTGVYVVPGLPADGPPPLYWAVLADWIRRGYRVEPPYAPRPARARRDLDQSWIYLEEQGWEPPRDPRGRPVVGPTMPGHADEEVRLLFHRQALIHVDLSGLTLPRTLIRQCEVRGVNFQNTDMTESRLCRNNFIQCDFREADLSHCDLRASVFDRCKFGKARLGGADFRRCTVSKCTFRGADALGAIANLVHAGETDFAERLTRTQRDQMEWHDDPGDEPDGA